MPMDRDQAAQALLSGEAWAGFCDALKAAGAELHRDTAMRSPLDAAEGYRFMTRMLRSALELVMEGGDPASPFLMPSLTETIKVGWDNPDNRHTNAYINGAYTYRVVGTRGDSLYMSFGVYGGSFGKGGGRRTVAYVSADALEVDADGRFEVILSEKPHPGNWIQIDGDATTLMIRETFSDRPNQRAAELRIERADTEQAPPPLDPAFVASALRRATRYVQGSNKLFFDLSDLWMTAPNTFFPSDPQKAAETQGIPGMYYASGWWQCAEDEAIVLDVVPPRCRYWGFVLSNYWGESFDYLRHPVHTNMAKASCRADGSLRLVVAHRDPAVSDATWISTAGHVDGIWTLRWLEADAQPHPEIRVVKCAELPALV